MKVRLEDIIIEKRRREDPGNLSSLAESIKRYGLIQPIVIDADNRLVAGWRRLACCAILGWEEIEARLYEELSQCEKSKVMIEYAQVVKEQEPEFRTESVRNARGRPKEVGSERDLVERTGIPASTMRGAHNYVSAADQFPFMRQWPQYRVLEAREYLEKLPEEEHESVSSLLNQAGIPPDSGLKILKNLAAKAPEQREIIYRYNERRQLQILSLVSNIHGVINF